MGDSQGVLKVASSYRLGRHDHPLLGQANIWVEDSLRDRGSIAFVQWLVQQAIEGTAPGQVEVGVYDAALTGLSSPFDSINGGGEKLLRLLGDERELIEYLSFLREHVQGVHNVIKGQAASLTEFRRQVSYPVEGYKLVVVVCDFGLLGEEALNLLAVLLKVGPSVGVSFVVHSMTMGVNPFLVAMCDKVTVRDGAIEVEEQLTATSWTGPTAAGLIASATAVAKALSTQKMSPIAFADIQPLDANSSASSADGVSFAIGRYGLTSVEITLGDELNQRHNMLITGAVGQGKSNLISVMIHSLCVRYPPDELEMYLLDFKEGVTFQPFVTGPEDSYLPHARVLGLEADREFALSVLEHLFSIYRSRMATFKEVGVANLRQYRAAGRAMPRILLVIDEFQLMFTEGDRLADTIAGMLVKAVRLFRAAGIHVVLASQTIGGNLSLMGSAGEGLFGQVPVRVALKNSVSESHATLSVKNDAAAHLRSREAIVNVDYGAVEANRKASIAFADDRLFESLRFAWWRGSPGSRRPFVFAGAARRSVADDGAVIATLSSQREPCAVLGAGVDVDGTALVVPLGRDVGRNVALIGSGPVWLELWNLTLTIAASCVIRPKRMILIDLLAQDDNWVATRERWAASLKSAGCAVETIGRNDIDDRFSSLRQGLDEGADEDVFLIGVGLDRCRATPLEFQNLCRLGPPSGLHILGWWLKLDSFKEQIGYGGESTFDVRMAFRLEPQAVKLLMNDPLLDWRATDNRALAWDVAEMDSPRSIIPYAKEPH